MTDAKNRYPITADTLGGQKITYQVGYIGFDKANQNAVVVLQNSFNWSNYIGHAILQHQDAKSTWTAGDERIKKAP